MNRRQRRRTRKGPLAEINVVPYIDVMLVLLVIFMITAPLLTQGVDVNLPQAAAKSLPPTQVSPIIVSVNRKGQYYLNISAHPGQPINGQQLMAKVAAYLQIAKQKHQQQDVYVKGDRDVNYGEVVHAMVLLQNAGASQVGLLTQQNSTH